jgi:eukaryotic-like serine/threonine-protein kinase
MRKLSDDPDLEARVRARLGTTLRGKYRLDDILGIGGMAAVYSATHRNGRRVAVKLLHPELALSSEAKTRFLREGLVANAVRHAGVVTILDDDTNDDGAAFLVMELLEGTTLDELWEQQGHRLPLRAVVSAGVMLLDVLSAAHAAGVVHRDIKPANLFLTHAWELKILDFGISRLSGPRAATATQTGMMMGSPAFMAPEQALGRSAEIDGRTDLWSAAASLFTLASGQFVHEGQTAQEMLIRAATTPVRSFAAALPGAPALVVAVIDRALAFGKAERWGTASEMAVALSEAARASFGEEPSAGTFAAMLPFLPPTAMPTPGPVRLSSVPPRELTGGMTELTSSMTGPIGDADKRRKRALVLGTIAGLGIVMGMAVLVARSTRGTEAASGAGGLTGPVPTFSATASVVDSTDPPSPPSVAVSALPIATAPTAAGVPPAIAPGRSPASTRSGSPSRANTTPPAQATKPSTFIPSSPTAAAPSPAGPCNPPYRYDFFGNKVAKSGCSL